MKRFIVIQIGARMHYAVPALLAQAGMLHRFYTDICADGWLSRSLGFLPEPITPKLARRFRGRRLPPEIPWKSVLTFPVRALLERAGFGSVDAQIRRSVLRTGFGHANALYSLSNADEPILRKAKERGMFTVHEQILNPDVGWILREERQRFPDLEEQDSAEQVVRGIERDQAQWDAADRILCPSSFVLEQAKKMGAGPEKIALVPYGVSGEWLDLKAQPERGRILFVGTVGLRKGSHYLAAATRELRSRKVPCEVRVAGPVLSRLARAQIFEGPRYLGQVPRAKVREEFLRADVFVLPTLSDGSALVHLEALACGVPVITTPNCGSIVRDGIDGFLVPIRDVKALTEKIELLVTDRRLRKRMSENARARAREYSWDRYKERLLGAVLTSSEEQSSIRIHV